MVLFDSEGKIHKYKNALEVMEEFVGVRLHYYKLRKEYLIDKLTLERDLRSNSVRFIALICAKKLHASNRKKADVVNDLVRLRFQKFGEDKPPRTGFEYLLIMQISSLTKERSRSGSRHGTTARGCQSRSTRSTCRSSCSGTSSPATATTTPRIR